MRNDPGDQLKLDVDAPERARGPRSRRLRVPEPPTTDRVVPPSEETEGRGLFGRPVLGGCGFCGSKVTVMEQAALCAACGGIVLRPDDNSTSAQRED